MSQAEPLMNRAERASKPQVFRPAFPDPARRLNVLQLLCTVDTNPVWCGAVVTNRACQICSADFVRLDAISLDLPA